MSVLGNILGVGHESFNKAGLNVSKLGPWTDLIKQFSSGGTGNGGVSQDWLGLMQRLTQALATLVEESMRPPSTCP